MTEYSRHITLLPESAHRLASLCGRLNEHIKQIETGLNVSIQQRGNVFQISGNEQTVNSSSLLLEALYATTEDSELNPNQVHLALQEYQGDTSSLRRSQISLLKRPAAASNPAASINVSMSVVSAKMTSILV